jgi:hypothetical protein
MDMKTLKEHDNLLRSWAKQNAETIYRHLETKVDKKVDWRDQDIANIVTDWIGLPSEYEHEPYCEELVHILDDATTEFGIPIPSEIIALRLSIWIGKTVPTTHPLVQHYRHWYETYLDFESGRGNKDDIIQLFRLVYSTIPKDGNRSEELAENLPSLEDIENYYSEPEPDGYLYTINTGDSAIYLAINDTNVTAMDDELKIVVLDFEGNIVETARTNRVKDYIIQGLKFSKPVTDRGELASLVGNHTADMLLGTDGISVFDLLT